MQVTEIYKSIQGESTHAGLPCVFVRLTGCNLRCSWCDSEYAFNGGHRMTQEEVVEKVEQLSPSGGLVEVTGGEPMLQEREVVPVMQRLLDEGYTVLLETSGERPLERVPKGVVKIVDVKCPNSGEPDTFCMENLETLNSGDEVKFVLSDRSDYEFARDFLGRHHLPGRVNAILFLRPSARTPAATETRRTVCSILVNWQSGCWPTMCRLGSASRSISLFGTRR